MKQNKANDLIGGVIKNDYCIGCGACEYVDKRFSIQMDAFGMFKARFRQDETSVQDLAKAAAVCPFSDMSENEDELAQKLFPNIPASNPFIGKYLKNYVGFVGEGQFRGKGSSGGIGKWILNELLQKDEVDYVIQVVSTDNSETLFAFRTFTKDDDILKGAKSAYYPITLKDSLDFIRQNAGRYAITALPCFSKAVRNIALHDKIVAERVRYIVSPVCGHLKSTGFAESLAWQLGVPPKRLGSIEFRDKIEGKKANEKGVYALDKDGNKSEIKSSRAMVGGDWGHSLFKYKACDYCDDIVGETADISIGDAWIKDLMSDDKGNSVITVRNAKIAALIDDAIRDKRLCLTETSDTIVADSQMGGIRHKREGLAYRLQLRQSESAWAPQKRVQPSGKTSFERKRIYALRERSRDASHKYFKLAKEREDLSLFLDGIASYTKKFKTPLLLRVLGLVRRKIKKIIS